LGAREPFGRAQDPDRPTQKARRIEHRIAGADANPYLVLATMLAGIHHGVTNGSEPPPASEGNAGSAYDDALAFRPRRTLEDMAASTVLADYFGADFVAAYVACKLTELDKFDSIVSPAEYEWFLQTE
jgi:glutamine synthetase